jgi:hypothetical protein
MLVRLDVPGSNGSFLSIVHCGPRFLRYPAGIPARCEAGSSLTRVLDAFDIVDHYSSGILVVSATHRYHAISATNTRLHIAMSRRPFNIHGNPLPPNCSNDGLGSIKPECHDGVPQEVWIITGSESSRQSTRYFLVNLGLVSSISHLWDVSMTRNRHQRTFHNKEILGFEFRDEEPQTMCLILCIMHKNTRMLLKTLNLKPVIAMT